MLFSEIWQIHIIFGNRKRIHARHNAVVSEIRHMDHLRNVPSCLSGGRHFAHAHCAVPVCKPERLLQATQKVYWVAHNKSDSIKSRKHNLTIDSLTHWRSFWSRSIYRLIQSIDRSTMVTPYESNWSIYHSGPGFWNP